MRAAFACALTALVGACAGVTQDGGQTGSSEVPDGPKIPPDQDGPVRFGPDTAPPTTGPVVVVADSGVPPAVVAVGGEVLYVADTSYGVRRFSLAEPLEPEPVESLALPGGASGLMVVGESLVVLGAGVAEGDDFYGAAFYGAGASTVIRRGPVSPADGEFQLPESLTLPGVLLDAQVVDSDRLIVLTQASEVLVCTGSEAATGGLRITEIRLGDELELGTPRSYPDLDGFMSKPGALLLTRGTGSGPTELQLVTLDGELQEHARFTLESLGLVDERTLFQVGETWIFRYVSGQRSEYGVVELTRAEPTTASFVLPWAEDERYYQIHAVDHEQYTLFTRTTTGSNGEPPAELGPGVVVDWSAEGGPQSAFEIPAGWRRIWPAGEYLVAELDVGLQVFQLSDTGIELVGEPLAILGEGGTLWDASWDAEREALWVTYYAADDEGNPSSITNLGRLDLAGAPVWSSGIELMSGDVLRIFNARFGNTTYAVDFPPRMSHLGPSRLLAVDIDSANTTTRQVVPLEELDLAIVDDIRFALAIDLQGTLQVIASDAGDTDDAGDAELEVTWETRLSHRAEQLLAVDGKVLAVGRYPTNDCYPETQGQPADPACTDAGRGGITVFEPNPGAAPTVRTTLLPAYDVDVPDGIAPPVVEWMEVARSQRQVGLLQHRGYSCRTASECDILGVELGENSGQRDETWLYPFDVDTATFGEPIQLPSRKPFDLVTTEGLVGDERMRFMHLTATAYNPDGVHVDSAIIELLTLDGKGDGDEQSSVTLDGYPLLVDSGDHVVTVRPTQPLASAPNDQPPVSVSVLELYEGAAYRVDSLDLGEGLLAYAWARHRGVFLLPSGTNPSGTDCDKSTTIVSVEYHDGAVRELGRVEVHGQEWSIEDLSDEKVVLSQGASPVQFVEVRVTDEGAAVTRDLVRAWKVPVTVTGERVEFGEY